VIDQCWAASSTYAALERVQYGIEEALIPIATSGRAFTELPEAERSRHWLPGRRGLQHAKLRYYAEHFELCGFFKFSILRNPWDRAISQITYLRTVARSALFRDKSFKEQIQIYCDTTRHCVFPVEMLPVKGYNAFDMVGIFGVAFFAFTRWCRRRSGRSRLGRAAGTCLPVG
jgi:hypothetical protein